MIDKFMKKQRFLLLGIVRFLLLGILCFFEKINTKFFRKFFRGSLSEALSYRYDDINREVGVAEEYLIKVLKKTILLYNF